MKKTFLLCIILSVVNIVSIANAANFFAGFKMPVTIAHRASLIGPQYFVEWLDSRHALLTTKENTDKQIPAGNHELPQQNHFLLKQQASEIRRLHPNMIFVIPVSDDMVADLKKQFQDSPQAAYEDGSQSYHESRDKESNYPGPGDEDFDYQAPGAHEPIDQQPSDQEPGDKGSNYPGPGDEDVDYQAPGAHGPSDQQPSDQEPGDKGLNYQEPGDEGLDNQESGVQSPSYKHSSSRQQKHHQKKEYDSGQ